MTKYEVYLTDWQGTNTVEGMTPYAICDTLEDAFKACEKAWDEELAPDEAAYIFHNGILKEDFEWKN